MSAEAVGWAWRHSPYRGVPLVVHLAIADSVNDQHNHDFWMTVGRLAAKARVSERAARTALRQLTDDGLLVLVKASSGKPGQPTLYRFVFGDGPVVYETRRGQPVPPSPGATGANDDARRGQPVPPNPSKATQDLKPLGASPPAKRKAEPRRRLPDDFTVTLDLLVWARDVVPTLDLEAETAAWRDHHHAKGSTMADWPAAWRLWMRNAHRFATSGRTAKSTPTARGLGNIDRVVSHLNDREVGQ